MLLGQLISGRDVPSRLVRWWPRLRLGGALLALALIASVSGPTAVGAEGTSHLQVSGAGRTIIEGGTGGTSPLPVVTVLAFHANGQSGAFECLALAPAAGTGDGSGRFEVNAMYVTGKVTSVAVTGHTAVLRGVANVTGLGAGQNVPFTATVQAGGPGTTVTLDISGLTFHEILLEGRINIGGS
ncbi:MAG TPA: hypothetical protein VGU71_03680 [Candidatus Dormibacteraeota bacterium]|nr:hypothetical protein [Candidatus Dormibacteraeota bacterium]